MNTIQLLRELLQHDLPQARLDLDSPPLSPTGIWWLDLVYRDRHVIIEWKGGDTKIGFSLSDGKPEEHYGWEPPDETAVGIVAAVTRIKEMVDAPAVSSTERAVG
jgi:hypothetical protein